MDSSKGEGRSSFKQGEYTGVQSMGRVVVMLKVGN